MGIRWENTALGTEFAVTFVPVSVRCSSALCLLMICFTLCMFNNLFQGALRICNISYSLFAAHLPGKPVNLMARKIIVQGVVTNTAVLTWTPGTIYGVESRYYNVYYKEMNAVPYIKVR